MTVKMNRIMLYMLILTMVFSCTCAYAASFNARLEYDGGLHAYEGALYNVLVDGKGVSADIPPVMLEKDRCVVCVREIFESLGADVAWTPGTPNRVVISYGTGKVSLAIDDSTALVNDVPVQMEIAPKLITYKKITKTMVPVRFVAETLGMAVDYIAESNTIALSYKSTPASSPTPQTGNAKALSLTTRQDGTKQVTTVCFSQAVARYTIDLYNDPSRVVVDVYGASSALPQDNYTPGGNIAKIRTATHDGWMRIVFDVGSVPAYTAALSGDKTELTVTLTSKAARPSPSPPATPSSKPIVVIDAGHGGNEVGALGQKDGQIVLYEKNVNLAVSLMVVDILKKNGVDVRTTRTTDTDVSLSARTDMANSIGASLFVSIHCNAFTNTEANGSLVMHHTTKDTSAYGVSGAQLAGNILKYLPSALGTKDAGRIDGSAMWVIRKANMPSVIVEMAFITNEADRIKLGSPVYQQKAAQAIASGILDTLPMLKK